MPLSKQDTALLTAAERGDISGIDAAIKSGAKLTARDENGNTVLLLAALEGNNGTIDHLVKKHGCRLDERNNNGDTALLLAAWRGHNGTIDHLVRTRVAAAWMSELMLDLPRCCWRQQEVTMLRSIIW